MKTVTGSLSGKIFPMKKSNIILLLSFILLFGTLAFSRYLLVERFRQGKVHTEVTKEFYNADDIERSREVVLPAVRNVFFSSDQNNFADFAVIDSAVHNQQGDAAVKIVFKGYKKQEIDLGKVFMQRGDTLFIKTDALSEAQVYLTGLRRVLVASGWAAARVDITDFTQDSLSVIGGLGSNISISQCHIRYCRLELGTDAKMSSYVNHIDSLSVNVERDAVLTLNDFDGEIVSSFFDYSSRINVNGGSLRTLSRIKWDD